MTSRTYSFLFCLLSLFSSLAFSQEVTPAASAITPPFNNFFKTTYLNLSDVYSDLSVGAIEDLLPPPAKGTTEIKDDSALRSEVYDDATKTEIHVAKASQDSIFAYSYTLGEKFSPHKLPKTQALFDKVDDDVRLAIYIAKRFFGRRRPMHSSGYSYPSGHSTRAFLWDTLLTEIYPNDQAALRTQAKMKAWNRVILGRHYPDDVYAGEAFGTYLAQKLLENPAFQKDWQAAEEEIKNCLGDNPQVVTVHSLSNYNNVP